MYFVYNRCTVYAFQASTRYSCNYQKYENTFHMKIVWDREEHMIITLSGASVGTTCEDHI